jgi:hypothetical protein
MTEAYITFENGMCFRCSTLTRIKENICALALEEEHTDLGRALVDALWFSHPIYLTWIGEQGHKDWKAEVYRCHIAGPLFKKKLLEVRSRDPERDMASAWEIHLLESVGNMEISEARDPDRAKAPERHLDHPTLHRK